MKLSIIIPSFNTRALTLRCIECIRRTPPATSYEVILVDNHSSDASWEAVRQLDSEVIALKNDQNLGFSKACNRGAAAASGDYLLFLNSDTEPVPGAIDRLVGWLDEHPRTGIVGPELIGAAGEIRQMSWGWNPLITLELVQQYFAPYTVQRSKLKQRVIRFLQRKSRAVPSICGACLMIRRTVFDDVAGFDQDFELYFEDSDLCFRCSARGWQIDFVAESKIVHYLGQSTRGSWSATSIIYQQSHLAFYRKHAPRWAVAFLKTYLFFKWLRLGIVSLIDRSEPEKAQLYRSVYRRMIAESTKVTLEDGLRA
jgi:GT2 family glycosyltransferase